MGIVAVGIRENIVSEAIQKGQAWLDRNGGRFMAETETGEKFKDNFMELLILEATGNWRLVDLRVPAKKWNYFGGKPVVTADPYPDDIDTQSVAHTLYFDHKTRPRICVEACADVCTFFYMYGRGHQVRKSFDWVLQTLKNRDFGSKRYYFTIEPLFYYVFRLVSVAEAPELIEMRGVLRECLEERVGQDGNSLSLAIRLLLCQKLGIYNSIDLHNLVQMQEDDGEFGVGWIYCFGKSGIKIGHRGFTCALAVEALKLAAAANGEVKSL